MVVREQVVGVCVVVALERLELEQGGEGGKEEEEGRGACAEGTARARAQETWRSADTILGVGGRYRGLREPRLDVGAAPVLSSFLLVRLINSCFFSYALMYQHNPINLSMSRLAHLLLIPALLLASNVHTYP